MGIKMKNFPGSRRQLLVNLAERFGENATPDIVAMYKDALLEIGVSNNVLRHFDNERCISKSYACILSRWHHHELLDDKSKHPIYWCEADEIQKRLHRMGE